MSVSLIIIHANVEENTDKSLVIGGGQMGDKCREIRHTPESQGNNLNAELIVFTKKYRTD